MALEDLYREVILDHYRSPRNRDPLPDPELTAEGVNPLCGDEVTIELDFDSEKIAAISVRGHGCSISQSSGSMMSEAIKGLDRLQVTSLATRFQEMLTAEAENGEYGLGDLEALKGVRRYPVRIKCALLPWTTLIDGLPK
ncbi:MAG TPA: SUF system NifU family Fe-S cluster assembly protein [Acidimicrobiia bacterium]|nr:SUF system NifU family Fe-S cluster assembly protein [Acidimicrobiia bacterium]